MLSLTSKGSSTEMHDSILLAIIECIGYDLFAVAVCEEIYRPGRDNTHECRPETFEQGWYAFIPEYISVKCIRVG